MSGSGPGKPGSSYKEKPLPGMESHYDQKMRERVEAQKLIEEIKKNPEASSIVYRLRRILGIK